MNNPLKFTDPDGEILPLIAAYLVAQIALSLYDLYNAIHAFNNPNISGAEKFLTASFFFAGIADPVGGGYSGFLKAGSKAEVSGAKSGFSAGQKLLGEPINITEKGLQHTTNTHTLGGKDFIPGNKSYFNQGENIESLIKSGTHQTRNPQTFGTNFERIFDAGRNIGVDRGTGQQTSIITIITNQFGDLITSFPGKP